MFCPHRRHHSQARSARQRQTIPNLVSRNCQHVLLRLQSVWRWLPESWVFLMAALDSRSNPGHAAGFSSLMVKQVRGRSAVRCLYAPAFLSVRLASASVNVS